MQKITNALGVPGKSLLWNKLHRIKYLLGLMLCVIGISLNITAAPSDLDLTFGSGGKVISSPDGSQTTYGYGMALQPDGKIVMVGGYFNSPGNLGFIVARYNADGSLDTKFGSNGWNSVTFGYSREAGISVALQPDGKIVVGGPLYNGGIDIGIVRFNPNGSLDTSFDGDGKVIINSGTDDEIFSLQIANDGKIVFAGDISPAQLTFSTLLGRLNADGSRDTTFGTNGLLVGGSGRSRALTLLPDGAMVVAGNISLQFSGYMIAAKYNNDGTGAWGYSQGGNFISARLNGVAAQPDGKIVMVGHYQSKIFATRLNANGIVDNSFNISAAPPSGEAFSVAVQPDGKIVANISVNGSSSFSLVRYNTNGSFDSGFGNGGIVVTAVDGGFSSGQKLLIQPDGKLLVGGWSSSSVSPTSNYFSMVRYKGGASVSRVLFDYDGDGKADISVFRPSENKWYVLRSSDSGLTQQVFAIAGDVPVPADYDGDGKTDMAIYRPSSADWWSLNTSNGVQAYAHWGQSGVIPLPSDFDGDGKFDYIFFLPSNSTWYRYGTSVGASYVTFGLTGDKPVTGDFDGDGKTDVAIFRPSTGDWWWQSSIDNVQRATHWGISTDLPAPADYDGDGKTDFAVFRPSEGNWYVFNSSDFSFTILHWGIAEDKPVAADYDGDGKADIAVFRPSSGIWYILRTTAGYMELPFGINGDIPTPYAFTP